jgi:SAM-dependent methyltransferase
MRQNILDFVSLVVKSFPIEEPVYEFGSLDYSLKSYFEGKKYVGADMRPGAGVDEILDLHNIALPSESVGTVVCMDTLEHVEYPHLALQEIHRILKPGGAAYISSVMKFHIHEFPNDYWRFTPEAFRSILKPFTSIFVEYGGEAIFPHTVIGVGFKGAAPNFANFNSAISKWKEGQ